jgi:putative flippase GtrA
MPYQALGVMKDFYRKHDEKIKYLIIGVWNTLFGYSIFIGLYYLLHERFNYLIILVFSYVVGITNSYICYKIFVFKTKGNYFAEYLRFFLVYGASFLINIILMPLFVEIMGLKPVPAQGIILFFTVIVGYLGHKHFSFNTSDDSIKRIFANKGEK